MRENLNGESGAAFGTTSAQYGTAVFRCHSGTKTVGSFSFNNTGLERSFHCSILNKQGLRKGGYHRG